jgi:lipoprotein-anchoring transpeptidase ErfK/SrfK
MVMKTFSRKDFLNMGNAALGALALPNYANDFAAPSLGDAIGLVRVGSTDMRVFSEPVYTSDVLFTRKKNELFNVYEKFISPYGPAFNPRWYRVEEGYAHTAYLQPVKTSLQEPVFTIREGGQVAEVSVPITQSMRFSKFYGWEPMYRLYYESVHWVTDADYGPNMEPWYELTDDLLKITYWVQASHMRLVGDEELAPIAQDVPAHEKRVEVSIKHQSLTAYQEDVVVMHTEVSTGIPNLPSANGVPTATPRGTFNVEIKMPARHMGNGKLTSDIYAYELPGVPWVSFFVDTGVAFHGTFWHDNYGNEMSHGCVNMRPAEAKWLYRWLTPVVEKQKMVNGGKGTKVIVT